MNVFTHGSVINFQESCREMFLSDIHQFFSKYLQNKEMLLFGTIDLHKEEIYVLGHLKSVFFHEEEKSCTFQYQMTNEEKEEFSKEVSDLEITHDATFDILDEQKGAVRYQVLYITFRVGEEDEITYFIGDEKKVSDPLACITEFWQYVSEVGRDVDFSIVGCRAKAFCK